MRKLKNVLEEGKEVRGLMGKLRYGVFYISLCGRID